jgi:hypothetical protein
MLFIIVLSVAIKTVMLFFVKLSVVILSIIVLSVAIKHVMLVFCYAKCRYAVYHCAECRN